MTSQYLPGTASLVEEVDKQLLVVLIDGRTLIGYLRTVDQFANLVLHQTVERIHVGNKFSDIERGIFIVRGENVLLLGEPDSSKNLDELLQRVSVEEILELQREEQLAKREQREKRRKAHLDRGQHDVFADDVF